MKIFLLTPIYATTTSMQGSTPVVHYFAREWVKMGHEVTVFHFVATFPRIMYWVGRHFQHQLNTRLGMMVPTQCPQDEDYFTDGVSVHKRCLKKMLPHSRYSNSQLKRALNIIKKECSRLGVPDWFIGHWDNPQLELLSALKKSYGKSTCLVLHENVFDFEKKYGGEGVKMLFELDAVGFRSLTGKRNFEKQYGRPKSSFIASSGVSEFFLKSGEENERLVQQPVRNYVFVGSLIARKYPLSVLKALSQAYPEGDFSLTFIGDGAEKNNIEEEHQRLGKKGELYFTGRIPRERIVQYLRQADVLVMISRAEIFGLVYLEAMALGVIPVGSRNEGVDGVIVDGKNGFLCKAGDVSELTSILRNIKQMPSEQLVEISRGAKETAFEYSDSEVAKRYLEALKK
ncbi:MAG: glycosyltransferase family 4 protein [Bacteroidales bacterium]|nr:glycosyltransferase family 4 protein [Bacteroidales bacterium]